MKLYTISLYLVLLLSLFGCKKDLGNYDYTPPSEPTIASFKDATFDASLGDSLIMAPKVVIEGADPIKDLEYEWKIFVDEEARADTYQGYPLKIVYNLAPRLRDARLSITDKRNGMKYVFPFQILGTTPFSIGKTVLSVDNGVTKLSFIKSDNSTVLSDIYRSFHGEDLPVNPVQLFAKPLVYQGGTVEDYWVVCQDGSTGGVILNGASMLRKRYFKDHFLAKPATVVPDFFDGSSGLPVGVINGKLYISISSTAPFAPDFGKFANPQEGDYALSKYFRYAQGLYYFGFDTKSKAFVSFNSGGSYNGTNYTVVGTDPPFDPKNIGMDNLLFMEATSGISYAFFRTATGQTYQFSFSLDMNDYNKRSITPRSKKLFKEQALVLADSKWVRSAVDIFYFSSNDKIYRYNPINEDLRVLAANFGGKKITMLKLSSNGNVLTAGVERAVMTLDVKVGASGNIVTTVTGIPGAPIDLIDKDK